MGASPALAEAGAALLCSPPRRSVKRDAGGSRGCERCGFQVSTALGAAGRRQVLILTASRARTAELSPRDPQPPDQVSVSLCLSLSSSRCRFGTGPFRTAGESGWALQSPAVSDNAQNLSPAGAGGARGPGESVSRVLCARTPAATCRCGGRMGKLATFCSHQPSARLFLLLPSELARVGPHPRPGGALRCLRVSC